MTLVLLPFWTSVLVKAFALTIILGRNGIVNGVLSWLTGMEIHLPMVLNQVGLFIGMTNFLVPLVATTNVVISVWRNRPLANTSEYAENDPASP